MAGQGWPKAARLRKRPEFLRVQNQNVKASGQGFTALARPNKLGRTRLGITVSSKVGNSVVRNQVKRWVREAFRTHPGWWPVGIDLVLIAKPGSDQNTYLGVCRDLERMSKAIAAKLPKPAGAVIPSKR
jgi:ribonuclease P protein component